MENFGFEDLFGRDHETGETIFHELAKLGALGLLYRIYEQNTRSFVDLLQIKNHEGDLCTHVVAKYHSGFLAIDLIELLVLMGADLNGSTSCARETVLHRTVYDGDYELVEWLCRQQQINLDAENYSGLTAYQLAYKRHDEQLKRIFRKAGANCEEPEETLSQESDEE